MKKNSKLSGLYLLAFCSGSCRSSYDPYHIDDRAVPKDYKC